MTDDIVKRLRGSVCYASTNTEWPNVLLEEAADEIERLAGELKATRQGLIEHAKALVTANAELTLANDRIRELEAEDADST